MTEYFMLKYLHVIGSTVLLGTGCALPKFPGVYSEVNNAQIRGHITSVSGV